MIRKERQRKIKKLDKIFSEYIRSRDGKCLWCGGVRGLQCAHIIGRANLHFRWDPNNAIALCLGCHIYKWHKDPLSATAWLKDSYPEYYNYWQENRYKSFQFKIDLEDVEMSLNQIAQR
jgi:5-methylcytosine-specific restriction endonuclease McrA